jgi:hypothetical protein
VIITLPEVELTTFPLVRCKVHPDIERPHYAVCRHVLAGRPYAYHREPHRRMYGYVLCEHCYLNPRREEWAAACPRCVDRHILQVQPEPRISVPEPTLADLLQAEREAQREFTARMRRGEITPPANPYIGDLAWVFDLSWRAAVAAHKLQ